MISGARQARPNRLRRLVAGAAARELVGFAVPGPEVARARGLDLEAAGLPLADTPRHAGVLVVVGELPAGLKGAAAVAYAQMPRPRAILGVGSADVSPLPRPDASAGIEQGALTEAVAELRRSFAEGAFSEEAPEFDAEEVGTRTEYVCPMHPEVVGNEPGTCPKCGMELVARESAGGAGDGRMDHHGHDHAGHDGMGHTHGEHVPASGEHPGGGGHVHADHSGHRALDHNKDPAVDEGHGHGEHASHEEHERQPGSHDEETEQGGREGHFAMEHEEAAEDHGSSGGTDHGHTDQGEHGQDGDGHDGHAHRGGHDHTDHGGDMGFMSMVEMTKDLPRSPDGLPMEWVEVPFGPLFPGLPGGLSLILTLDGDAVAEVEAAFAVGVPASPGLAGPAAFVDGLAGLDPLSPVAYGVLATRAIEDATEASADEPEVLARIGALERERAASHLGWLAGFAHLIGYAWLERRAAKLQLAVVRARDIEEIAGLRREVRKVARRVGRTPLLARRLRGLGRPPEGAEARGPIARAAGRMDDARLGDEAYLALGFEPALGDGNDALSRMRVRLEEAGRSLELAGRAGYLAVPRPGPLGGTFRGAGAASLETPRGRATIRVELEEGAVSRFELDAPSLGHLALVGPVTEGEELGDALVGVASLDLSPWGVIR